jgi:hypothetical protein
LFISSPSYTIYKQYDTAPDFVGFIKAVSNEEDGYIELSIVPKEELMPLEKGEEKDCGKQLAGMFLILRASAESDYKVWEEVYSFEIKDPVNIQDVGIVYRDFLAIPGMSYKYGIKKYNNFEIFTKVKESNAVLAKYSHIYLYDGTRQLKFNFNPSISSIKQNILETKHNTLGRQYPIFMKNGILNFKEFQLTALNSYLSDENFQFIEGAELYKYVDEKDVIGIDNEENSTYIAVKDKNGNNIAFKKENINIDRYILPYNTNSSYSKYAVEKKYRDEVESFLINGKPKLYKSITEGGLIVRTSEVSFSPN